MKYENYEKIIIARLQCPELEVRQGELTSADLNSFRQAQKPFIYVYYQGSSYESPENLGMISQVETMSFEVIIFARKQRGKQGAYEAFETVTKRLLGWREKGMRTPVTFQKFGYVSETNTTYQYALLCSFTGYIVETREKDDSQPNLIKQITNNIIPA